MSISTGRPCSRRFWASACSPPAPRSRARRRTARPASAKQTVFRAVRPERARLQPAPGLSKVLAFAQDNEREFMQGVDHGLAAAAKDRGLEYRRALANNDAAKGVEQVQLFSLRRSAAWSRHPWIRPR